MGPVGPGPGQSSRGPRATNLLGVINKTVQIPMVGLNIESIVSFPHNAFQTVEGVIRAVIPVINRVVDSVFHENHNVSEKACISHTTVLVLNYRNNIRYTLDLLASLMLYGRCTKVRGPMAAPSVPGIFRKVRGPS